MGDFTMNTDFSAKICLDRHYPSNFAYPLPAVLFWRGFSCVGFSFGAAAWLLIVPACMIGSLLLSRQLLRRSLFSDGHPDDPYWGVITALAFAATEYYLLWDLRVANTNSVYLFVVLLGIVCWQTNKPWLAGVCLGGSVALKVYSLALLPFLLLHRRWRITCAMLASVLSYFFLFPLLYFGWHDTLELTGQWLAALLATSRPDFVLTYPAYKVSLFWVATLLLTRGALGGKFSIMNCDISSVTFALKLVYFAWFGLVAAYFATCSRVQVRPAHRNLVLMLDISVLLLCAFPASPFLQPHHLVVLLVPAVCLLSVVFDEVPPARARFCAGLTVGLGLCLTEYGPHYPLRGVGVLLTIATYFAGIWGVRYALNSLGAPHPMGPGRSSGQVA